VQIVQSYVIKLCTEHLQWRWRLFLRCGRSPCCTAGIICSIIVTIGWSFSFCSQTQGSCGQYKQWLDLALCSNTHQSAGGLAIMLKPLFQLQNNRLVWIELMREVRHGVFSSACLKNAPSTFQRMINRIVEGLAMGCYKGWQLSVRVTYPYPFGRSRVTTYLAFPT